MDCLTSNWTDWTKCEPFCAGTQTRPGGFSDLKSGFASRTFDLAKVLVFLALQISQHHGRQRVRWRSMWCVDTISGGQGDGRLVQQWCVFQFYRSPHKLMDKGNTTTQACGSAKRARSKSDTQHSFQTFLKFML